MTAMLRLRHQEQMRGRMALPTTTPSPGYCMTCHRKASGRSPRWRARATLVAQPAATRVRNNACHQAHAEREGLQNTDVTSLGSSAEDCMRGAKNSALAPRYQTSQSTLSTHTTREKKKTKGKGGDCFESFDDADQ